ncbi:AraC family transcriptional regulator [Planctomycetota bacterium]|nr:AraC family transcriptional regulator [Planctomycetota bacterium]
MGPAIGLAAQFQFLPRQEIAFARVESRMLLWCLRGLGQVWAYGKELPLPAGGFMVLPWGHRIRYLADRRQPWLLGGVHLVPRFEGPWQSGIAHTSDDPVMGDPRRGDDPRLPGQVVLGTLPDEPGIISLAEHLVQRWRQSAIDESLARAEGEVFLDALLHLGSDEQARMPASLRQLELVVAQRPQAPWDVASLAQAAGCQPAWLSRLFRRHLRTSPRRWLEARRLERARLLLTSTNDPVADIAAAAGFTDRQRLSRCFQRCHGLTPTQWRQRHQGP